MAPHSESIQMFQCSTQVSSALKCYLFIYLRSVEQGSALFPIFQDGEVHHKDTVASSTLTLGVCGRAGN